MTDQKNEPSKPPLKAAPPPPPAPPGAAREWLLLVIAILLFGAALFSTSRGCSTAPKTRVDTKTVVQTSTGTSVSTSCGGLEIGDTGRVACPIGGGFRSYVCTERGLILTEDGCGLSATDTETATETETATRTATSTSTDTGGTRRPCSEVVTFDELAPVIAQNCVSCHAGRDGYEQARAKYSQMLDRIGRDQDEPGHMPPGRPKLGQTEQKLFADWGAGGFLKAGECVADNGGAKHISLAELELAAFRDVSEIPAAEQKDYAYLSYADRIDAGASTAELATLKQAAAKAVASVSLARELILPRSVAPGLLAINVRDLELDGAKWAAIEAGSTLNFESRTSIGIALKELTGKRLPILPISEFIDIALRNAGIYYALTEAPQTFGELTKKLGVDYSGDLAALRAVLVGFNGSPLSPAANRLMSRHVSDDGFLHCTYDTGAIVSDAQNVLKNPLLFEAGGRANLRFAAGECLYSLPNGMLGGFLALAKDVFRGPIFDHSELNQRLDFADPAIVHDYTSNPLSPFIRNEISCNRCHAGGILRHVDEVREKVLGPASGLDATDARKVDALFKKQPEVDRIIAQDNARFGAALRSLGIDQASPDPITAVSDRFLGDLSLNDVAGLFYVTPDEFRQCLSISAQGQEQAGQLLRGGTLSHDQLLQVKDALIADCGLLEDPISGGAP